FSRDPRDLHSFPTRRSSDLGAGELGGDLGIVPDEVPQEHEQVVVVDQVLLPLVARVLLAQADEVVEVIVEMRVARREDIVRLGEDRKSTRLNSSHVAISYAV